MNKDITQKILCIIGNFELSEVEQINELEILYKNQDLEIERLNNLLKETSQTLSEETIKAITLKSENERLNNIIKELEKWLYDRSEFTNFGAVIDKIKELKGSDKE